ncbi:MAG: YHYH protein [Verrucomicrobiales bacterium]|nr:YHYH protein [Verrucomicrobiales bacterium]
MQRRLLLLPLTVTGFLLCLQAPAAESSKKRAESATVSSLGGGRVIIAETNGLRVIRSNGLPDHAPGQFPNAHNPNALSEQDYTFQMTLQPRVADHLTPADHAWFGVALNGVPFEPGTAEFWRGDRAWNYEAMSGQIDLGIDAHNAHVQPNGAYHYHGLPLGLGSTSSSKAETEPARMRLIGWAADGFPIYDGLDHADPNDAASPLRQMSSSYRLKTTAREGGPGGQPDGLFTADYEYRDGAGDLDECHGRFGVTPEYPEGIYHYHITSDFPLISRQWRGTPDSSFLKQHGPGTGRRPGKGKGKGKAKAPPPRRQ